MIDMAVAATRKAITRTGISHESVAGASLAPVLLPDGRALPVRLRVSARARLVALRLMPAGEAVELVVPVRVSLPKALDFLDSKRDWIASKAPAPAARVAFEPGAAIPILGRPHRLVALGSVPRGAAGFTIQDGEIRVAGKPEHLARRTSDGLKLHARRLLEQKTLVTAQRLGRAPSAIGIGDAVSRWGSCSAAGRIRYAWRLILAPEPVVDYVVAHEVAHLIEMNHGPRFWRLVERLHPAWRQDRAWLKSAGAGLLLFG